MSSIPFISKKVGNNYLVWFQNSNHYVQLEEPAWFVFKKITKRYKTSTIAFDFASRYGFSHEESLVFVNDIGAEIKKLNQKNHSPNNSNSLPEKANEHYFTPFIVRHYKLGNQVIAFSFASLLFEYWIHPLISHFETTEVQKDMPLFELFEYQEHVAFRYNGKIRGLWTMDETQYVKGMIFMYLVNVMHDKTDEDWLMTVHASAISNGKKTILFSAEPGKGKTTFAALLQQRGYQLISDDFVPIDRESFRAYPFPIAISVKQGSMDLLTPIYPDLVNKKLNKLSADKFVRYLAPPNHVEVLKWIFPVIELIFIEYNSAVDFNLEKIEPVIGLKMLLDQAWVPPMHANAKDLLDRLIEISFFKLSYSNNQKALDAVADLFNKDQ